MSILRAYTTIINVPYKPQTKPKRNNEYILNVFAPFSFTPIEKNKKEKREKGLVEMKENVSTIGFVNQMA